MKLAWRRGAHRMFLPVLGGMAMAGAVMMAAPAQAQFSASYKFLEAVRKKDGNAVEEALSDPASTIVNTRDVSSGETALHIVTQRRDVTWMTYLISKGANVNTRDARGTTPMQVASNLGFTEGVELLVSVHARIDDPDNAGETPLISAVHRRDVGMMRILLKAGADPDRKDNSGRSARDYAALDGHGTPLIAAIETDAVPRGKRAGGGAVYGPSF